MVSFSGRDAISFKTAQHEEFNIIACPDLNSNESLKGLEMGIKTWQLSPCDIHLFDFKEVRHIHPDAYRIFTLFKKTLSDNGKALATVNMNKKIEDEIIQKGLKNVFSPVNNLNEAKKLIRF